MKKLIYLFLGFALLSSMMVSCNDEETYADQKKREAEQINKSIMSMLANSLYAIKKKADKASGYSPVLRVTVAQEGNHHVIIKIYDNGIGIEEGIIGKIFDPFFTTKPTAEAPGVGLYLSQQVLHDCGGTLAVQSVKDEYTEFVINLT